MPAYNASAFIEQALDSVMCQTYRNIEVCVVDDGSLDHTLPIITSLAKNDERIKVIEQPNKGVAAARNLGIQKSIGEFIAPIDADDLWDSTKIEKQVDLILSGGPKIDLVYTWWISIDESGTPIYNSPKWQMAGDVFQTLIAINFIGNVSVPMFRRECIQQVGGYNTEWKDLDGQGCEDWDLSLRIAQKYQFAVVPEYLVKYRSVRGSMAGNFKVMKKSHELMIEGLKQRHPEIPEKLFRSSTSNFYIYLAGVSYKSGNFREAARWVGKALFSRHAAPFSRWTIKLVLIGIRILAYNLLTSLTKNKSHVPADKESHLEVGNKKQ